MDAATLLPFIRDVGIPAAILLIVLLRIEPKLQAMTTSVDDLTHAVEAHMMYQRRGVSREPKAGDQR